MAIRIEQRGSYPCVGEDGNRYTVVRLVNVHTETHRGQPMERDGDIVFRCNGHPVGRLGKGRYRTWTGVDLRACDPTAP
jgi:hypothetical protein